MVAEVARAETEAADAVAGGVSLARRVHVRHAAVIGRNRERCPIEVRGDCEPEGLHEPKRRVSVIVGGCCGKVVRRRGILEREWRRGAGRRGTWQVRVLDYHELAAKGLVSDWAGPALRALFEEAEDSAQQLDAYIDAGEVLTAIKAGRVVGHLQLIDNPAAGACEVKNMAVEATHRAAESAACSSRPRSTSLAREAARRSR